MHGKCMVNALNHLVYSYNNPVVILSSISFFCFFKNIEIGYSKFINYIAGSVLAVLLKHTSASLNPFMKEYFRVSLENYPDLKSNQTMITAMQSMNEVEEHISAARRFYNSNVNTLKNAVEIFPGNIVAMLVVVIY